ncbi:MAG: hypothetical protein JXR96_27045 [Deltaproteobacteria bacterium]|nr:hypothetical protein [Deltaproteobacteria bacterium]
MSSCDLQVILDRNRLRQGEPLTGEVRVAVNKEVHCKGLTLESQWQTHGRGERDKGKGPKRLLFRGKWRPHEKQAYRFSLPTASGPCSYHGDLINVVWRLQARADIPWALDPKAAADFALEPGPVREYYAGPEFKPPSPGDLSHPFVRIFIAMVALGLTLLFVYLWPSSIGRWISILGGLVIVLGVLYPFFRSWLAQAKIHKPIVMIETPRVDPGGVFKMRVAVQPRRSLSLNQASVRVAAVESAQYIQGTQTRTVRQTVFSKAMPLDLVQQLRMGQTARARAEIQLPAAPLSFAARHNRIDWSAELHLDIPNWPDWKKEYLFTAAPGPGFRPQAPAREEQPRRPAPREPAEATSPRVARRPVETAQALDPVDLDGFFDDPFEG